MKAREFISEAWSQKYKSSINCSHPKGFSQRAHCAGKKKHNESVEMEMVCEDCGMCQTHGNLNEIRKGEKDSNGYTRCWPGKHAEGTKTGKNGGQVRNCVPNESIEESEGKRCRQCGMINCKCPGDSCKCKPIKGWIPGKGFKNQKPKDVAEALTYPQKHSSWSVHSPKKNEFNTRYKLDQEPEARAHAERIGGKLVKVDQHGHVIRTGSKGDKGVTEGMEGQVVFSGSGANGGKYEIIQTGPTDFMIHANGKHIDTYSSLQRAMSVLKNEVPGLQQGVAEGIDTEELADEVYAEFERIYPNLARRANERTVHAAIMDVLNYGGDNDPGALAQDVARAVKRDMQQDMSEGICSLEEAHAIFDDFEQAMAARGLNEDAFDTISDEDIIRETAAWRRSAGKSKKGGLNAKGVASYRREHPGSKLQMAVTTKPSKLKPGSKAAKRRKSFCARMSGVKGPMKKPNGKPTRKALALRKWNC